MAWLKDLHSLKLTFSHLKMNGWKTFSFPFGAVRPIFKGELAVSFRGGSLAMFQGYSVHRDAVSLLALRIATGRRHQIRIHLAAIGCPTFNDALYLGDLSGLQMSKKIHPKFRFDPKKLSWQCLDTYHIKLQFYIQHNIQKRTQSGYGKTGIGQPDMESARQNIQLRTANWV